MGPPGDYRIARAIHSFRPGNLGRMSRSNHLRGVQLASLRAVLFEGGKRKECSMLKLESSKMSKCFPVHAPGYFAPTTHEADRLGTTPPAVASEPRMTSVCSL